MVPFGIEELEMPVLLVGEQTVTVDDSGFILQPEQWNREVAEVVAQDIPLWPLTPEHWRVILFVRAYFEEHKAAPMLRAIIKRTRINEKKLRILFPRSCRECMCRIAGLPQPTG